MKWIPSEYFNARFLVERCRAVVRRIASARAIVGADRSPVSADHTHSAVDGHRTGKSVRPQAPASALWNPTGNPFDLRPDLASLSVAELAEALLGLRNRMAMPDVPFDRRQLHYFERLYSAALWHRAHSEETRTVVLERTTYEIRTTPGEDVYLVPVRPDSDPAHGGAGLWPFVDVGPIASLHAAPYDERDFARPD
jgi:hypothetical protein